MLCVNTSAQAQTYLSEEDTPVKQRYYPSVPCPFGQAQGKQAQRKRCEAGPTLPPKGLLL